MTDRVSRFILWVLQIVALVTILAVAWLRLDRELFALVCAVLVLVVTMYIEYISRET